MNIQYRPELNSTDQCFRHVLSHVAESLRTLKKVSPSFGKSKTIRQKMDEIVRNEGSGWQRKVKVNPRIQEKIKAQNYFVEYICDFNCDMCKTKHRLLAEICFDNREAIPANILKLDMGIRNFKEKVGGKALGLIICLDTKAREVGEWDNSVGTADEYELALDTGYRDYLDESNFIALEILV